MWRLKRRGLVSGYIQCTEHTESGLAHKHIIFRGRYIDQVFLSRTWRSIHKAYVVDIRRIKKFESNNQIASYLAKYMAKEGARYSWSWGWLWRGFAKDWQNLKKMGRICRDAGYPAPMSGLLHVWKACCRSLRSPPSQWHETGFLQSPTAVFNTLNLAYLGVYVK